MKYIEIQNKVLGTIYAVFNDDEKLCGVQLSEKPQFAEKSDKYPSNLDSIIKFLTDHTECGCFPEGFENLDTSAVSPFRMKAYEALIKLPKGKIITYADLAELAGSPKAVRAAGGAMANNPFPLIIPCHRVVGTGGKLTGFASGLDMKSKLLNAEGAKGWRE